MVREPIHEKDAPVLGVVLLFSIKGLSTSAMTSTDSIGLRFEPEKIPIYPTFYLLKWDYDVRHQSATSLGPMSLQWKPSTHSCSLARMMWLFPKKGGPQCRP